MTSLTYSETPSNPQLKVTDIAQVVEVARSTVPLGRHDRLAVVVDATWATPYLLRPLSLGADLVLHSATKYIGGHSDMLGGVLVVGHTAVAKRLVDKLVVAHRICGGVMGPWESYLSLRGLRTLHVRMDRHCSNALAVAQRLVVNAQCSGVLYPGLESHPQHTLAKQQMGGRFGGMLSFLVRPRDGSDGEKEAMEVLGKVRLVRRATSLGGTESLIEHRRSVEGSYGTSPPNLLRVSVGLEAAEDIIGDIEQALLR
jgi:cystathionine gamma-synthase